MERENKNLDRKRNRREAGRRGEIDKYIKKAEKMQQKQQSVILKKAQRGLG